jgi:hypothetical protein
VTDLREAHSHKEQQLAQQIQRNQAHNNAVL